MGYDTGKRRVLFYEQPRFLEAAQEIVDGRRNSTIKEIDLDELTYGRIQGMMPRLRTLEGERKGILPVIIGSQTYGHKFRTGKYDEEGHPLYDEVKSLVEELMMC